MDCDFRLGSKTYFIRPLPSKDTQHTTITSHAATNCGDDLWAKRKTRPSLPPHIDRQPRAMHLCHLWQNLREKSFPSAGGVGRRQAIRLHCKGSEQAAGATHTIHFQQDSRSLFSCPVIEGRRTCGKCNAYSSKCATSINEIHSVRRA